VIQLLRNAVDDWQGAVELLALDCLLEQGLVPALCRLVVLCRVVLLPWQNFLGLVQREQV